GVILPVGVVEKLPLRGRVVWIERDLIEVAARLSDEAQLVVRIGVVNQRSETAKTIGSVVNHGSGRSLQAEIGTVSAEAGVIGETICVPAEVELVVSLIEISGRENKLGFVVTLESRTRRDVENAIRTVAVVGRVTSALRLHGVNVFWVDLRAEVAGDIGVRDGNAVDQPGDLMAAANVQLVMDDVRTRNEISNQRQAVGSRSAGRVPDFEPVDESRRRNRFELCGSCVGRYGDRF